MITEDTMTTNGVATKQDDTQPTLIHLIPAMHVRDEVRILKVRVSCPELELDMDTHKELVIIRSANDPGLRTVTNCMQNAAPGMWISTYNPPTEFKVKTEWVLDTHPWIYEHHVTYVLVDDDYNAYTTLPAGIVNEHKPILALPLDLMGDNPGLEASILLPDSLNGTAIVEQSIELHAVDIEGLTGHTLPYPSSAHQLDKKKDGRTVRQNPPQDNGVSSEQHP